MEILIALVLISLVFTSFRYFTVGPKENLRFTLEKLEKIIQFASQEAIMRGSVVRLRFSFDKLPQEWILEYGPDGDFILPSLEKYSNEERLTLMEQERRDKELGELNRSFQAVPDFAQGHEKIPMDVLVLGLATTSRKDLVNFGDSALYFYPTGEKDSAILLLGINQKSNVQILKIEMQAYLPDIKIDYYPIEMSGDVITQDEIEQALLKKSKELHQEWVKG